MATGPVWKFHMTGVLNIGLNVLVVGGVFRNLVGNDWERDCIS